MRGPLWRVAVGALSWRVRSSWAEAAPGLLELRSELEDDRGFPVDPRVVAHVAGISPRALLRALREGALYADRARQREPQSCPVVRLACAAPSHPIVEVSP